MSIYRVIAGAARLIGAPGAFSGALVSRTTNKTIPTGIDTQMSWSAAVYDFGGWFPTPGSATLTVPAGISRVRMHSSIEWEFTTGTVRHLFFEKEFAPIVGLPKDVRTSVSSSHFIASPVINVVPGDRLQTVVFHDVGVDLDVLFGDQTFFAIEAVRA